MTMATVLDAYAKLGLSEGCTLEEVRASYKKLALTTHPDKDKSEGATKRFQELGSAYNCLEKHFDHLANPSWEYDCDYSDYDDDYPDDEDDLPFFIFIFDEVFRGRTGRFNMHNFTRQGGPYSYPTRPRSRSPQETEEEYQERLRKNREEQKAATERRAEEERRRKERKQQEREKERVDAERRREEKIAQKRAQEEAERIRTEGILRNQKRRSQEMRSAIFAAARQGDTERVKKGIWEDDVDPDGGEIKRGCEEFVKNKPKDLSETLLHIAARLGNAELVEWLDKRVPEVERNSAGMTAFHIVLIKGYAPIVRYFIDNYPPQDNSYTELYRFESESVLRISVRSGEPENVFLVLHFGLANVRDLDDARKWFRTTKGQNAVRQVKPEDEAERCIEEISNLLMNFDSLTPPATPPTRLHNIEVKPRLKLATENQGKTAKRNSMPAVQNPTPRATPSPSSESPQNTRSPGEGRGRGRGKARGKARGRGGIRT